MSPNQRSEMNNQTNNGGNEKGTPGSKGTTGDDGPLAHTHPQGGAQPQGSQQADETGSRQSGSGPGMGYQAQAGQRGGSMQTQQSGGTGAVQGITDSHQRAVEQRSGAYGELEQPMGGRSSQAGAHAPGSMGSQQGGSQAGTQGGGQRGPLSAQQAVQGGSMGSQQSGAQSGTQGGGHAGHGTSTGTPAVKQGGSLSADQNTTDRTGSQTGSEQSDAARTQSNDSAGGLPRSPGGTGPTNARQDSHLTGAQVHKDQQQEPGVHDSNDAAGGYPKSPGGANKLAADEKMDDDTGFSNT